VGKPDRGFAYTVDKKQVDDYRKWPMERRVRWLLLGNRLRKSLPQKTKDLHDAFRQGKI
jgi:hypothetical protein